MEMRGGRGRIKVRDRAGTRLRHDDDAEVLCFSNMNACAVIGDRWVGRGPRAGFTRLGVRRNGGRRSGIPTRWPAPFRRLMSM